MKKQIQFGLFRVYDTNMQDLNNAVRSRVEEVLNNGWELNSWQIVALTKDEANNDVVNIAICLTRELEEVPAKAKVKSQAEPQAENA